MSAGALAMPQSVAMVSFFSYFVAFVIVEHVLTRSPTGDKRRGDHDRLTFALFFFLPVIGVWLWMYYLKRGVIPWEPTWIHWGLGVAFALAGFAVRVAAKRVLGRFFTIRVQIHEGHELVQEGLYSRIRHPLYTGFLLEWCSPPFLLGSPVGLLFVTLPMVLAVLRRIPREEAMLIGVFGDRYRDYMRRTKRLIPGVW